MPQATIDTSKPAWCEWCGRDEYDRLWHSDDDGHEGERPGVRFDPTLRHRRKGARKPKVSKWFKADTAELVAPEHEGWINLRDVEALAWMVREAYRKEFEAPYSTPTVIDLISGKPSCVNGTRALSITGLGWKASVAYHLRYAILCQWTSEASKKWRAALGLSYGAEVVVPGPTVKDAGSGTLQSLIGRTGRLAWSLNTHHAGAIAIHRIALRLGASTWIEVEYGFPAESSSWFVPLAEQETGEPLAFTIERAGAKLGRLLDPKAEPPLVETWASHGGKPAAHASWVEGEEVGAKEHEHAEVVAGA